MNGHMNGPVNGHDAAHRPARRLRRRARRWYGEGDLHALLLAASFALAGYAGVRLLGDAADWFTLVLWFAGAAVLHDLVLVPLYGLVDRVAQAAFRTGAHTRAAAPGAPAAPEALPAARARYLNHLRVPAALAALLLLVYFPLISGARKTHYKAATALDGTVFLGRWLLITAALFGLSAAWLVVSLLVGRVRSR